jgi:hypothetical protein
MALPQWIYFRATDNETDPTNADAEVATSANYPRTSAQSNSVGHLGAVQPRDRNVETSVLLKGICFEAQANTRDYKILLPASGNYKIRLAMGDSSSNHNCRCRVFDDTTQLLDIDAGVVPSGQYADAAGTIHTSGANWVSNNALSSTLSFSTTTLIFRFGGSSGGDADPNWVANAVYVEAASGSPALTKASEAETQGALALSAISAMSGTTITESMQSMASLVASRAISGQQFSEASDAIVSLVANNLASSVESGNTGALVAQLSKALAGSAVALAQGIVTAVGNGDIQLSGSTLTIPSDGQFTSGIVVNL